MATVAFGALMLQTAGCITIGTVESKPEIDLFDPEVEDMMIKEPTIIPGFVLFLEVTSGGMPVVPGGPRLVSLRNEITVPLVGAVDCTDLTLRQLQEQLKEEYVVLYNNPEVILSFVINPNDPPPWGTVGIYGRGVVREGRVGIPSTNQLTLTRAIQELGGLSPIANRRKITVTRTATQKELPHLKVPRVQQKKTFSYDDIASGVIPDPRLLQGDTVHVPEIIF